MVDVNDMIFSRSGEGTLIPQEVELTLLKDKPKVKLVPLTRGKLQEIYAKATSGTAEEKLQVDNEIIKCGLVEPKMTDEQLVDLKPDWASALTTAILAVSLGITQEDVSTKTQEVIAEQELELKK